MGTGEVGTKARCTGPPAPCGEEGGGVQGGTGGHRGVGTKARCTGPPAPCGADTIGGGGGLHRGKRIEVVAGSPLLPPPPQRAFTPTHPSPGEGSLPSPPEQHGIGVAGERHVVADAALGAVARLLCRRHDGAEHPLEDEAVGSGVLAGLHLARVTILAQEAVLRREGGDGDEGGRGTVLRGGERGDLVYTAENVGRPRNTFPQNTELHPCI